MFFLVRAWSANRSAGRWVCLLVKSTGRIGQRLMNTPHRRCWLATIQGRNKEGPDTRITKGKDGNSKKKKTAKDNKWIKMKEIRNDRPRVRRTRIPKKPCNFADKDELLFFLFFPGCSCSSSSFPPGSSSDWLLIFFAVSSFSSTSLCTC